MNPWLAALAVGLGGAVGANLRHWAGRWVAARAGADFPWATLAINLTGAFVIGFLSLTLGRISNDPRVRLFVFTGVLGGYTTFSTYSMEALLLLERGQPLRALGYLFGSAGLGLAAVVAGASLGRRMLGD